ncbi:non-ribosomal peptide synthetase [Bacillus thuringiensis]|uniref:non-ribosomal peptide synthetase n=1 Tax=Bacillus thuringiensis TaxID=1428 RepID=UPI00159BCBAA|nr:non-ribosomal peptide synthetase [Bacillus thuringiensis]
MYSKNDVKDIYTLTPMQEGMIFNSLINNVKNAYYESFEFEIEGKLDIELFQKTVDIITSQNDVLRSVFIYKNQSEHFQVILKKRIIKVEYKDISDLGNEKAKYIDNLKIKDKDRGFDLSKDVLMRIFVIKKSEDKYTILLTFHHIILDGWSLGILFKDFKDIYGSLVNSTEVQVKENYPYNSYFKWLKHQNKESTLNFWREQLSEYEYQAGIPYENTEVTDCFEIEECCFKINADVTRNLNKLAVTCKVSNSVVFHSLWGMFLQIYNDIDDVVFGSIVSGRPSDIKGIENMIGLFINAVPVRVKCDKEITFMELIKNTNKSIEVASDKGFLPLSEIQSVTGLRNNLINHVVVYENYPVGDIVNTKNMDILGFNVRDINAVEQTNYDFNVVAVPGNEINIEFKYNNKKYSKEYIDKVSKDFINLCRILSDNPEIKLNTVEIIRDEEVHKIVNNFNNTGVSIDSKETVIGLFEEKAEEFKDKIAVMCNEEKISYEELNSKANQLARKLIELGVTTGDYVGIMVNPCIELIIGILAVLKTGAAYLPIDSEYENSRIKYMLKESNTRVLLTEHSFDKKVDFNTEIIYLDEEKLYIGLDTNLDKKISKSDDVYLIYTSGTTGRPKGVRISNISIINYVMWITKKLELINNDKAVLTSSYAFDLGYTVLYSSILNGCELTLVSKEIYMNPEKMIDYLINRQITYIKMTPSLFTSLVNSSKFNGNFGEHLKTIILGGENIILKDVEKLLSTCDGIRVMNHYGPTECTIGCISQLIDNNNIDKYKGRVVLGKPINNMRVYILDKNNNLLPIGVKGEIAIAGEGLAIDYLHKENLNKEKFIMKKISNKIERIYKTGDVGKVLEDGTIKLEGRRDNQIKIRGFRVELEEIANILKNHTLIENAIVLCKGETSEEKHLYAYIVVKSKFNENEFKEYIESYVPYYMIPSYFIRLDKIPITANGKIDTKALPEHDFDELIDKDYEVPRDITEQKLVGIWKEILKRNKIGINSDFFILGGHSLNAMILISKIYKELNVEIPLRELFKEPTIKGISNYIKNLNKGAYTSIKAVGKRDYYDTLPIQKRLYTSSSFDGNSVTYNMPNVISIEGRVDKNRLEAAFNKIVERYDIFRTSFDIIDNNIIQEIQESIEFNIGYVECSEKEIDTIIKHFIKPFDLKKPPLLRAMLLKIKKDRYILMFDVHHAIFDGLSKEIFLEELFKLYDGQELIPVRLQYKDYIYWFKNYMNSSKIKAKESYWLEQYKGDIPVLNMPIDYERSNLRNFEGSAIEFHIDEDILNEVKRVAQETQTTVFMVMFSIYYILLSKYTGQEDIIIGTVCLGRIHPDSYDMLGLFINTLPIRCKPERRKPFNEFLKEVKTSVLLAQDNQEYSFEELINKLNITRDKGRNLVFDTVFNMYNKNRNEIERRKLKCEEYNFEHNISKFDFSIDAELEDNKIKIRLEYSSALFKKETIEGFAEDYTYLTKEALNDINRTIESIKLERKLIKIENNDFGEVTFDF